MIKDGWLTWAGELGLIALAVYVGFIVEGKTAFICLVLLILGTMLRHYRKAGCVPYKRSSGGVLFQVLYLPVRAISWVVNKRNLDNLKKTAAEVMRFSYLIMASLSFLFALSYRTLLPFWNKVPGFETVKSRLIYSTIGIERFSATLFGNDIPEAGAGLFEKNADFYYFLDNTYVRLFLVYGILMLAVFTVLMTVVQFRLCKHKRYYAMFVLTVFSLSGLMEFEAISFSYNVFAVFAACRLSRKNEYVYVHSSGSIPLGRKKKLAISLGIAAMVALLIIWSVTAYHITAWRGWTPDYGATIVVLENNAECLDETKVYMESKTDASCIVCGEEEKQWLEMEGIDSDRIWVLKSDNLDQMLMEARNIIQTYHLPPRLTVCAYNLQQARITHHAERLGITVNSLAVRPEQNYLSVFATEQWRLLWGE